MSSTTPLKRALLIGCPHESLRGVANDVQLMHQLLESVGFDVIQRLVEGASREGILEAFRRLVEDVNRHDAVLVFYSGHGGLASSIKMNLSGAPPHFQYLVPVDFSETTDEDFRGITDVEISHFLRDLTRKTENVTAIFDCCHSAGYRGESDDVRLPIKSITQDWHTAVGAHIKSLRSAGKLVGNTFIEGNPNVVRVTAAALDGYAWECRDKDEHDLGVLTHAIHIAVSEIGTKALLNVSWGTFVARVRELVRTLRPEQRPEVTGPASRLLFQLDEVDLSSMVDARVAGGQVKLTRGLLGGVQQGDIYAVYLVGRDERDIENAVAQATVTNVGSLTSEATAALIGQQMPSENTALVALPWRKALQSPVEIMGDEVFYQAFAIKIDDSPYFARTGLTGTFSTTIKQNERSVGILDDKGKTICLIATQHTEITARTIQETLFRLNVYCQARRILSLSDLDPDGRIAASLIVEFGVVVNDKLVPRRPGKPSPDLPAITEYERIYLKIVNDGESEIWVSVFDIGLAGSIHCLTKSTPCGKVLKLCDPSILGKRDFSTDRKVAGIKVGWPTGVPRDGERQETLVVVASSEPLDLSYWPTSKHRTAPVERLRYDERKEIRYHIKHIGFRLRPRD